MRVKFISADILFFIGLVFFSIIPDIGISIVTAGFHWTAYRLYIFISLVYITFNVRFVAVDKKSINTKWLFFMMFWAVYGFCLLLVGKYSDMHNGFVEWLSIVCGFIVMAAMTDFLKEKENRDLAINVLYWLLNLMVIIGAVEIATGLHLPASAYNDVKSTLYSVSDRHQATGLMYNVNDFSAMITCLAPILICERFGNKRFVTIAGIVIINLRNDATVCNLAIIGVVAVYLMIMAGRNARKAIAYRFWCASGVFLGVSIIIMLGRELTGSRGIIGAIARQVSNAGNSTGSLYARLLIYKDACKAWMTTGMLGMGPSGFSNYFVLNPSGSGLVNPHSLVLEILSQYGVIVCVFFVILLIRMFVSAFGMFYSNDRETQIKGLTVVAFVIVYFIVSFAPSTFIGYAYQWMLIALMCSLIESANEGRKENCLLVH